MMVRIVFVMLLFSVMFSSIAADDLKGFAPPEQGMVRYALHLEQQPDESAMKVELIVGKTVETDKDNHYFFGGTIEAETVKGWGYTQYNVRDLGPMAGTLMAVDPNAPKVFRFIKLGGDPYLIRYNSRLPIVVYVPDGVEVRYRIWTAQTEIKSMDKE